MKKVMLLIAATFLSKIIAFGKELIFAYYYGTSDISDIYFMALTIPVVVFGFFSSGISSGFVPTYKRASGDESDIVEGNRFTNGINAVLIFISIVLIIAYFPFNHVIVDFFAKGFSDAEKEITIVFSNIMVFSIIFRSITTVMSSFLQSNEQTSVIGLLSIPLNLGLIISIVLSAVCKNIIFLPWGYLIACSLQAFVFVVIAKKNGYAIDSKVSLWNENIRFFLSSIIMLTIGSSVVQINVLVDKMLASTVSVGGVASLEYGNRILDLISGIFTISISTVLFPKLVNSNMDKRKISACFHEGIKNLSVFLFPVSFVLFLFPKEIITLVYARGAFDNEAVELTSPILAFYGIGLIAIGVRELVSKLYYALGDMKTPVVNAVIGVTLNIILNFVLVNYFGVGGLALATSITAVLMSIGLLIQIRKKIILKLEPTFYLKVLMLSILSSIICKLLIEYSMIYSYYLNVIISFLAFNLIYLIGLIVIGVFDIQIIKNII